MQGLSATDVAIRIAKERGSLQIHARFNKRLAEQFGEEFGPYWAIEDDHGLIEVALNPKEVFERTGIKVAEL